MTKQAVATATPLPPAPTSETGAIISMIERAARDPAVDVEKLRQLMELRERVEAKASERAFDEAMTACQHDMHPVAADASNPQTKSKYASLAAVDRALRPIYSKHGFGVSFDVGENAPEGHVRVLAYVTNSGHRRTYQIPMPADGKGAKGNDVMTKTHATGSAVSYGRRYLLLMIFNIQIGGEDDDGNKASETGELISENQVAELTKLIEDTGGNVEKFCKFAKVETLASIYSSRFEAAKQAIIHAGERRKAKAGQQS